MKLEIRQDLCRTTIYVVLEYRQRASCSATWLISVALQQVSHFSPGSILKSDCAALGGLSLFRACRITVRVALQHTVRESIRPAGFMYIVIPYNKSSAALAQHCSNRSATRRATTNSSNLMIYQNYYCKLINFKDKQKLLQPRSHL